MTEQTEQKPYNVAQRLAVSRDEAWYALTHPPVIRQWFGWDHPGLDEEIEYIFGSGATLLARERMGWSDGSYLEVTGDDNRSTVRAVRPGDESAADGYDAIEQGWRMFLAQLRFLLVDRPEGARRTVLLAGEATGRQLLNLAGGPVTKLDSRVMQIVTDAGHLILAGAEQPLSTTTAAGPVQLLISSYGLDDEAFAELVRHWTARWQGVARKPEITIATGS